MDKISLVQSNPIFAGLVGSECSSVAGQAIERKFPKGQIIVLRGDIWPYLFLIAEGEVDAVKESGEGRSLLVSTFGAGEVFWGLAFFHERAPMPVSLEARQPCHLLLWSRDQLIPFLIRNGQMSWELCRLMTARMLRASAILEELAFQPVAGRLARLLLDHFEIAGDSAISRHLTLDEMAARIGTTREMVCRALYSFSDKKLIEVTRTEFVLTDREGLSQMVERA
jgi:CRP/FNR family cyclic AMP-dependent transcriptional regulator